MDGFQLLRCDILLQKFGYLSQNAVVRQHVTVRVSPIDLYTIVINTHFEYCYQMCCYFFGRDFYLKFNNLTASKLRLEWINYYYYYYYCCCSRPLTVAISSPLSSTSPLNWVPYYLLKQCLARVFSWVCHSWVKKSRLTLVWPYKSFSGLPWP